MAKRVLAQLEQMVSDVQEKKSCFAATTNQQLRCLRTGVSKGELVEAAPSLFATTSYWSELKPSERSLHIMSGLQHLHPDWVFAGPSAAVAYGLAVSNHYLTKTWIVSTRKTHRRTTDYCQPVIVANQAVEKVSGLRLTSLFRTVGDCLRIMDFRSGIAVADSVLRLRALTGDELITGINSACKKMSRISQMRSLITLADPRAESGGESIARATMLELGLAAPNLQQKFDNPLCPGKTYRIDFAWDVGGQFILGELDGYEKYVSKEMTGGKSMAKVIEDEHRRQSLIEADPKVLRVVRFGIADVMRDWDFLNLLLRCGIPRTFTYDDRISSAGGILRCR